jgi:pimeloyl-ACP methyl ester carboxylesterase
MPKSRWVATWLAAALLITACSGTDSASTPTSDPSGDARQMTPTSIATPSPAPLAWSGCDDGVECATLTVPLDYADPSAGDVDLAVARRPTSGEDPIGPLVVNPGGPGGSGIDYVRGGAVEQLRPWFDIVSWDPRGIGASRPLDCLSNEAFFTMDPSPNDSGARIALDASAAQIATECATADTALLPTLTTTTAARDLEQLRRALGGQPLDYVGFSYGTHIGLDYASLFPDQVRAMVLDGVVDPREPLTELLTGQAIEIERVLADNLALYRQVAERVEITPLPSRTGAPVGPGTLGVAAVASIYGSSGQQRLHSALEDGLAGDGTALSTLAATYLDGPSFAGYLGVLCVDGPHPAGSDEWWQFISQITAVAPELGAGVGNELLPCAFWPAVSEPTAGVPDPWPTDLTPILLVASTQDAATPLEDAERVQSWVPNSVLLVREGPGHTSFRASACVRAAVQAYLVDLAAPDDGTFCPS